MRSVIIRHACPPPGSGSVPAWLVVGEACLGSNLLASRRLGIMARTALRVNTGQGRLLEGAPLQGARRGGSASSTPNSRPEPAQAPPQRGTLVARTAGVERESEDGEFDDQGSTRCAACAAARRKSSAGERRTRACAAVAERRRSPTDGELTRRPPATEPRLRPVPSPRRRPPPSRTTSRRARPGAAITPLGHGPPHGAVLESAPGQAHAAVRGPPTAADRRSRIPSRGGAKREHQPAAAGSRMPPPTAVAGDGDVSMGLAGSWAATDGDQPARFDRLTTGRAAPPSLRPASPSGWPDHRDGWPDLVVPRPRAP